ncbi:MAG: DUF3379 family protein [Gammaproteobacteria bacterium]|nr:DUF3379 family protein [Gammaproteobacteria bacterium]
MKCLEFKRLALSEPDGKQVDFVKHGEACPECRKYVTGIRQMDSDLSDSLDVRMPSDLAARLMLSQELSADSTSRTAMPRYALAASVAIALLVGGFLVNNQLKLYNQIDEDYQRLLAGVVEHMDQQPLTPVWDSRRANTVVNTLLASYDPGLKLKNMPNLQFGRICPMGEYKGLHASLETAHGQITFAYIKGESVGEVLDAAYDGYITRVSPVRGGNLMIISRSQKSLDLATNQLQEAMYWDL